MMPSAAFRQHLVSALLSALLFVLLSTAASASRAADRSPTVFAIVLASAPGQNLTWKPKPNALFDGRTLYVTRTTVKGKPWERLNLGFFDSRHKAVLVMNDVKKLYPGAWLRGVSAAEVKAATGRSLTVAAAAKPAAQPASEVANRSSLSDDQLASLMKRAKDEIKKQNYSQAIRFLSAVTAAGEHQYAMEALELLGLARQRKGQNAHAARIYREYLARYPDSDGAVRVSQRLTGLMTASQKPREKIHMETELKDTSKTSVFGSFSQYYRRDRSESDDLDESITTLSQLITFLDLTAIHQTTRTHSVSLKCITTWAQESPAHPAGSAGRRCASAAY